MRASDPQSFNRYSYTGNDPVDRIDPSGMKDVFLGMDGGGGGFLPGDGGAMGRAFPDQGSDIGVDGYYLWPEGESDTDLGLKALLRALPNLPLLRSLKPQ